MGLALEQPCPGLQDQNYLSFAEALLGLRGGWSIGSSSPVFAPRAHPAAPGLAGTRGVIFWAVRADR